MNCTTLLTFLLLVLPIWTFSQRSPCDIPETVDSGTKLWAGPEKAMYYQGQEIKFKVTSSETGTVEYTIRESKRSPVLEAGSFQLKAGETHYLRSKLNAPGFLVLSVTQNWNTYQTGVAIDPCEIRAHGDEPSDFDSFWDAAMQRARSLPHNVSLTYRADASDAGQRSYKFRIDNIDQKFISGWISIPTCTGPYPAIIQLPSYGREPIGPASHFASEGAIAIALSVHSYDAEKKVPKEIAYQPEDHYMDRNRNYFKAAIMGTIRTIDYLQTMPEYDGRNLAVTGVSQGGGLAIMVAGLDERVQLLVQSQAAFCDHAGTMEDHPSGFPYWVKNSRDTGKDVDKVLRETAYYDAVFFARRFRGKSLHVVGYKDDVCPPSTVFAAINAIPGDKKMLHGTATGHESHPDFWPVRREFFAENLPVSPYPECPDQATLTDTSNEPGVLPSSFRTYPNPITSTSRIELELHESRQVEVNLWNSQGVVLATLHSGKVPAGITHLDWDAEDLPPGVYLIRMSTPDTEIVKRVLKMNNR